MRHGKGLHTCSNGDVYKGYWRLDKRHGRGMTVLANGMQYEGEWVEDMAHGYARQSVPALCTLCWQRSRQQRHVMPKHRGPMDWSSHECQACMRKILSDWVVLRRLPVLPERVARLEGCLL